MSPFSFLWLSENKDILCLCCNLNWIDHFAMFYKSEYFPFSVTIRHVSADFKTFLTTGLSLNLCGLFCCLDLRHVFFLRCSHLVCLWRDSLPVFVPSPTPVIDCPSVFRPCSSLPMVSVLQSLSSTHPFVSSFGRLLFSSVVRVPNLCPSLLCSPCVSVCTFIVLLVFRFVEVLARHQPAFTDYKPAFCVQLNPPILAIPAFPSLHLGPATNKHDTVWLLGGCILWRLTIRTSSNNRYTHPIFDFVKVSSLKARVTFSDFVPRMRGARRVVERICWLSFYQQQKLVVKAEVTTRSFALS